MLDRPNITRYNAHMLTAKIAKQQMDALVRLRSTEFEPVRQALRELERQASVALAKADDQRDIYRLQGRVAFIESLLQTITQPDRQTIT